jgi:alkylhydroperoxidase family enzyme
MPYGKLSSRISELIILRVAWLCRCRYEWGQHIEIGQRRAKLTEQDIFNISKGYTAFQDEKEKSIILACDQLTLNNFIEQNNWDTLNNHLNTSQIIELQMLIGHYSMLAGVINSSGLQLEYSIENNLQEFYRRIQNL